MMRRLKRLLVTPELMVGLAQHGLDTPYKVAQHALPTDARIVNAWVEAPWSDEIAAEAVWPALGPYAFVVFLIASESFEELPEDVSPYHAPELAPPIFEATPPARV